MHTESTTPACAVQYRDIEGFPGYRVGDDGSVWSCWSRMSNGHVCMSDNWRPLKQNPANKHGHLKVSLCRNGDQVTRLVHHLVLEAFVGPRPEGTEACHDPDRDPSNNRLSNLRWDTPKANGQDRVRHGTQARGEVGGSAKLTREIVEQILILHRTEGLGGMAICRRLGFPPATRGAVNCVLGGRTWNHVTGLPKAKEKPRPARPRL